MTQSKGMGLKWLCKTRQKKSQGVCSVFGASQGLSEDSAGRGRAAMPAGQAGLGDIWPLRGSFTPVRSKCVLKRYFVTLVSQVSQISSSCKEDLYTWLFGAVFFSSFLLAVLKMVDWCTHLFLPSLQKFLTSLPLILLCNWISAMSFFC